MCRKQKIELLGMVLAAVLILSMGYAFFPGDSLSAFPPFEDEYLGQKKPGLVPELFAPGIISSYRTEHSSPVFSPDGKEVYWSPQRETFPLLLIEFMRYENYAWSLPQTAPFSGQYIDAHPFFSPDGARLYFYSRRPELSGLWYVKRTFDGWSDPIPLDIPLPPVGGLSWQHSINADGTLFITIEKPGGNQETQDIYRVELENGHYTQPVRMSDQINTVDYLDGDPCVAPDESYLVFASRRPGGYGQTDLYVSYKKQDGTWTMAKNMGYLVNSYAYDWGPAVSPDGLYLFFISYRTQNHDIYWIDAEVIEMLKPTELKNPLEKSKYKKHIKKLD